MLQLRITNCVLFYSFYTENSYNNQILINYTPEMDLIQSLNFGMNEKMAGSLGLHASPWLATPTKTGIFKWPTVKVSGPPESSWQTGI